MKIYFLCLSIFKIEHFFRVFLTSLAVNIFFLVVSKRFDYKLLSVQHSLQNRWAFYTNRSTFLVKRKYREHRMYKENKEIC